MYTSCDTYKKIYTLYIPCTYFCQTLQLPETLQNSPVNEVMQTFSSLKYNSIFNRNYFNAAGTSPRWLLKGSQC